MIDAGKRHDEAALDRIIGEEFRLSGPEGAAVPRDRWFANLRSMTWDSYDLSEFEVFASGDVAVVRSRQTIKNWRFGDRVNPQVIARVTDTWVKRDARWQLIQRTSERLVEP